MGQCTCDLDLVSISGQHVGGGVDPSDNGRPAGLQTSQALGASQAKVADRPLPGYPSDARGLGSHQRFKIQIVQQDGLYQLTFNEGAFYPQHRLNRKNNLPLPDTVYGALEAEITQIVQKWLLESLIP